MEMMKMTENYLWHGQTDKTWLHRHFALLVYLAWADVVITRLVLALGGIELNPIMNVYIHTYMGVGVKIGLTALIGLYLLYRKSFIGFKVVNGFMGIIVINNLIALIIQMKIGGMI